MISHPVSRLALAALAVLLTLGAGSVPPTGDTPSSADNLLRRMASDGPDDCSAPAASASSTDDVEQLENRLFEAVKARVADRLNASSSASNPDAASRATAALREVELSSADIDKGWPAEDRFHFKVLGLPPAILVEMSYRARATFVLFGYYFLDESPAADSGTRWREVDLADPESPPSEVDLYPLHRGPSGRPRFVARVWRSGCAGSIGEGYYGYEWSAGEGQSATEVIKIEGAEGLDDTASTHVGRLSTTGKAIQLPYCFFSPVDTWDNPTLCAADSFDLSGDRVVFSGRIYNSPDLVTVAKAIQFAEAHDYAAVRAYCASDAVATVLVRETPPFLFAGTLDTAKTGSDRETVVLADGAMRFGLVKRQGRWLVDRIKITADGP